MSTNRRRSTVYDLTSLRLHPDGTRVSQSSSRNINPRYARVTVQDSRGNWFARDAGGHGTVAKLKRVRELMEEEAGGSGVSGRKRKARGKKPDPRAVKRRKFYDDFEFLTATEDKSLPSSDLLKFLHYFAAKYYHEQGQLFNASREYRQMTKRNKQLRLEAQAAREAAGETEPMKPPRRGGRVKGKGKIQYPKDMYRVMEGSALMAIAMWLEGFVEKMLEVRIPEGWEEALQTEYIDSEEDVDEEDDGEEEPGSEGEDHDSERNEDDPSCDDTSTEDETDEEEVAETPMDIDSDEDLEVGFASDGANDDTEHSD